MEYVVDPERFFGEANYMVQTLMGAEAGVDYERPGRPRVVHQPRWRLIVIEDAGEFIREDAAAKTGQGLSRLLNLTDGLIGQGLRIMILMTTNEKFTDLAASVARTGRCLSHIAFKPFTLSEARAWLGETPKKLTPGQTEWVLADLYGQQTHEGKIQVASGVPGQGVYL
jgi:hypothetical protein